MGICIFHDDLRYLFAEYSLILYDDSNVIFHSLWQAGVCSFPSQEMSLQGGDADVTDDICLSFQHCDFVFFFLPSHHRIG